MQKTRSILIGLTTAALIGLPGVALASPATTGAQQSVSAAANEVAAQYNTNIRFLDFDHMQGTGLPTHIRGQVAATAQGQRGAIAGAEVKLYRQLAGSNTWVYQGVQNTTDNGFPQFSFPIDAFQNAHYKVVFAGTDTFRGSEDITWISVYRLFHSLINDGSGAATLHGHVDPFYSNKPISLQKRSCASCAYVTVKNGRTGSGGSWSFQLPAPQTGRWWWRATVPGTGAFIASYSATYTTQLS